MGDQITKKASQQRIVVGVDGSEGSKAALRWAITQAQLSGSTIDAVSAWQDPTQTGYMYGYITTAAEDESYAEITQKILEATVSEIRAEFDQPVEIQTRILSGYPALLLPHAARDADLLVVGSRGHGAFAGMLLGSVSQHCVQHPTCPVVVIPHA